MPRRYLRRILPSRSIMSRDRTLRIFGSLLHEPNLWHLNRRSVSLAVAVGLFMAFMPLPIQMLMAAATAIVVRCNLPVAVAVVWVSNPITVAPLFFAAYKVGAWLLGLPQRHVDYELSFDWLATRLSDVWEPLVLGCFLMGTLSALLGYFVVQLIWRLHVMQSWRNRRHPRNRATGPRP